ncbi:MAG: hypothetical protein ACK4ZM_04660 [bacterium]
MGLILGVGGIFYPALIGAYKLGEGYIKASKAAKSVGLNNWEATKAGIKGALALGVGEFLHGLFDAIAIGQLITIGGMIGGPTGFIIGATLGGGLYNLIKNGKFKE